MTRIMHICNRCGRQLPVGQRCSCQPAYRKDYNKFRRDRRIAEFRMSPEWRSVRQMIIDRDDGLDQYLLHTTGEMRRGFSVHHILPLSTPEGWARRSDTDNLITLSDDTHASIEYRYKGKARERTIKELQEIVKKITSGHDLS